MTSTNEFSNLTCSMEKISEAFQKVVDAFSALYESLKSIFDYDRLIEEIKEIISKLESDKKQKYNLYSVRNNCKKYHHIYYQKRKGIPYYRRDFSAHF